MPDSTGVHDDSIFAKVLRTHIGGRSVTAMNTSRRVLRLVICLAVLAMLTLGLAGCGGSVSVGTTIDDQPTTQEQTAAPEVLTLSKEEMARKAKAALEEQVGQTAPEIVCPEDIEATVGNTTTCLMLAKEGEYSVAVKITAVDGEDVNFDVKVAERPNP